MVLLGRSDDQKEYAGVGFLIAPEVRSSIIGFCQASNRYAALKLRVPGGKIAIMTVYAPQSGRSFDERFTFFNTLFEFWKSLSSHGPKLIYGDLNSRLYEQYAGEDEIFGPYFFKNSVKHITSDMNRFLLMEFCSACDLQIANTFVDLPPDQLVTYRTPGIAPQAVITSWTFAQLDLLLVEKSWASRILQISSDRSWALASQHFLIYSILDVQVPRDTSKKFSTKRSIQALHDPRTAAAFSQQVISKIKSSNPELNHLNANRFHLTLRKVFSQASSRYLPSVKAQAKRP